MQHDEKRSERRRKVWGSRAPVLLRSRAAWAACAASLAIPLGVGCKSDSRRARETINAALEQTRAAAAAPDRPPGRSEAADGLARLRAAVRAGGQRAVSPPGPAPRTKRITTRTASQLLVKGKRLFATLLEGTRHGLLEVASVGRKGAARRIGTTHPGKGLLLPARRGIYAISPGGIYHLRFGRRPRRLHRGRVVRAVRRGRGLYFAACREGSGCELRRMRLRDGRVSPALGPRFDVVHDLAWWRGRLWVAGRNRDPREGVRLSPAELRENVRWFRAGGPPPGSARYAPGFLAVVHPRTGAVTGWSFARQRPASLAADGTALYVVTEGSPRRGFSDGVLLRISADRRWRVLATGLSMPSDLKNGARRVCWLAMPARRFLVQCYDKIAKAAHTVVESKWNIFDFAEAGNRLSWAGQGIFQTELR